MKLVLNLNEAAEGVLKSAFPTYFDPNAARWEKRIQKQFMGHLLVFGSRAYREAMVQHGAVAFPVRLKVCEESQPHWSWHHLAIKGGEGSSTFLSIPNSSSASFDASGWSFGA